jgi:plasmid replication initiation protein
VLDQKLILTIDPGYFDLTGGLERWLYRVVRKHGGRQSDGWRFNLRYLHQKSGSLAPYKWFSAEIRAIVKRQSLPGYWLAIEPAPSGGAELFFRPACAETVNSIVRSVTRTLVRSLAEPSCDHLPKTAKRRARSAGCGRLNFDSNESSNDAGLLAGRTSQ